MTDAVTNTTIFSGTRKHTIHLTNISDGTGEAAVIKVNVSALTGPVGLPPVSVKILEAEWDIQGFTDVRLLWDANTDDLAVVMSGQGYMDWRASGGLIDPKSTGTTGDLLLTTIGASASATYDITLMLQLKD